MEEQDLRRLSKEELENMLTRSREELEELEYEWQMYFGMSGVHLNPGDAERLRNSLNRDKKRVEEWIEKLTRALKQA